MNKNVLSTSKFAPWNWFRHEDNKSPELISKHVQQHPITRLHQEMDRLFEDTFNSFNLPAWSEPSRTFWSDTQAILKPSVDVRENDNAYMISVEVPGVDESNLKLDLDGDNLIISGEKHQESQSGEGEKIHRIERSYGSFRRVLCLPTDAVTSEINASFKNGVLNVTVPRDRSQPSTERSIPINKE